MDLQLDAEKLEATHELLRKAFFDHSVHTQQEVLSKLKELPQQDPVFVLYLLHIFFTESSDSPVKQVAGTQFKNVAQRCIPQLSQAQQEAALGVVGALSRDEDPGVRRVAHLAVVVLLRIHGMWPELAAALAQGTEPDAPSLAVLELVCLIADDLPNAFEHCPHAGLARVVPNLLGVARASRTDYRERALMALGSLQLVNSSMLEERQGEFCRLAFAVAQELSRCVEVDRGLFSAAVQALVSAVMVAPEALTPFFDELTDFFLAASRATFAAPPGLPVALAVEVFEYWNSLVDDLPPDSGLTERLLAPRLADVVAVLVRGLVFTGSDRAEVRAFFELDDPTHVPDRGAARGDDGSILDRWSLRKVSALSLQNVLLEFPRGVDVVLTCVRDVREDPFDIDGALSALATVVVVAPGKAAGVHEYVLHGLRIANPLVQGRAAWLTAELVRCGCWDGPGSAAEVSAVAAGIFPLLFATTSKFVQTNAVAALSALIAALPDEEFWARFDAQFDAIAAGVAGLQLRPLAKVLGLLTRYCRRLPARARRESFVSAAVASLLKHFEASEPDDPNFTLCLEAFETLAGAASGGTLEELVRRVYPIAFGAASAAVQQILALGIHQADRWPDAELFYTAMGFITAAFARLRGGALFLLASDEFPLLDLLCNASAVPRPEHDQALFRFFGTVAPLFPARMAPLLEPMLGAILSALERPHHSAAFSDALWAFEQFTECMYPQLQRTPVFQKIVTKIDFYLPYTELREPIPARLAAAVCRIGLVDPTYIFQLFEKYAARILHFAAAPSAEPAERVAMNRGVIRLLMCNPNLVIQHARLFVALVASWSAGMPADLRAHYAAILRALASNFKDEFSTFLASFGDDLVAHVTSLYLQHN